MAAEGKKLTQISLTSFLKRTKDKDPFEEVKQLSPVKQPSARRSLPSNTKSNKKTKQDKENVTKNVKDPAEVEVTSSSELLRSENTASCDTKPTSSQSKKKSLVAYVELKCLPADSTTQDSFTLTDHHEIGVVTVTEPTNVEETLTVVKNGDSQSPGQLTHLSELLVTDTTVQSEYDDGSNCLTPDLPTAPQKIPETTSIDNDTCATLKAGKKLSKKVKADGKAEQFENLASPTAQEGKASGDNEPRKTTDGELATSKQENNDTHKSEADGKAVLNQERDGTMLEAEEDDLSLKSDKLLNTSTKSEFSDSENDVSVISLDNSINKSTSEPTTPRTKSTRLTQSAAKKKAEGTEQKRLAKEQEREEKERIKLEKKLAKERELEEKRLEKERQKEAERLEKLRLKEEKQRQKDEANAAKQAELQAKRDKKDEEKRLKDEEKQKKEEERKQKEEAKLREQEEKEKKAQAQKSAFLSFFKPVKQDENKTVELSVPQDTWYKPYIIQPDTKLAPTHRRETPDYREFDQIINTEHLENVTYLTELKTRAVRKSSNTWSCPIDDDILTNALKQRRVKFLQFHTDIRPAYYGTWRKRSRQIRPRNPLGQDRELDYEYDSADEWEEGEIGESVESDEEDEEEKDKFDFDPELQEEGFLVDHNYLSEDEADVSDPEDESLAVKKTRQLVSRTYGKKNKKKSKLRTTIHGCHWENEQTDQPLLDYLQQFQAIVFGVMPLTFEAPIKPQTPENDDKERKTPGSTNSQAQPVPEGAMSDLMRYIHGTTNGADYIVKEFKKYWAQRCQDKGEKNGCISKRQLRQTIRRIAVWEKRVGYSRLCWYVNQSELEKHKLTDLPIPNPIHQSQTTTTPGKRDQSNDVNKVCGTTPDAVDTKEQKGQPQKRLTDFLTPNAKKPRLSDNFSPDILIIKEIKPKSLKAEVKSPDVSKAMSVAASQPSVKRRIQLVTLSSPLVNQETATPNLTKPASDCEKMNETTPALGSVSATNQTTEQLPSSNEQPVPKQRRVSFVTLSSK